MPKKTLKRFIPSPARLREIKGLHLLGDWIYQPNLWHINRYSSSRGFFVGFFCAFMPVPSQMVLAALLSIWLRANLPLAIALCWMTNPLTMAPIFYFAYRIGATVMGVEYEVVQFELTWEWISNGLVVIWQPFLLGCLLCGFFAGSVGYFGMGYLWRWHAVQRWRARREHRRTQLLKVSHDVAHRLEEASPLDAPDTGPPENTSTP